MELNLYTLFFMRIFLPNAAPRSGLYAVVQFLSPGWEKEVLFQAKIAESKEADSEILHTGTGGSV